MRRVRLCLCVLSSSLLSFFGCLKRLAMFFDKRPAPFQVGWMQFILMSPGLPQKDFKWPMCPTLFAGDHPDSQYIEKHVMFFVPAWIRWRGFWLCRVRLLLRLWVWLLWLISKDSFLSVWRYWFKMPYFNYFGHRTSTWKFQRATSCCTFSSGTTSSGSCSRYCKLFSTFLLKWVSSPSLLHFLLITWPMTSAASFDRSSDTVVTVHASADQPARIKRLFTLLGGIKSSDHVVFDQTKLWTSWVKSAEN